MAQELTKDPIHCTLLFVDASTKDAGHLLFFVVFGLKNDRLAYNTFVLA
jgi:hypothetical protein